MADIGLEGPTFDTVLGETESLLKGLLRHGAAAVILVFEPRK